MPLPYRLSQKSTRILIAFALLISVGACLTIVHTMHNLYTVSANESTGLLTPKKKINLQKAMAFSFTDIISRYQKDYGVSYETALEHERELKRFLIISAENHPKSFYMLSQEVDNLWHTFLLFTKEYHQFCYDILGQFIHHVPTIQKENV